MPGGVQVSEALQAFEGFRMGRLTDERWEELIGYLGLGVDGLMEPGLGLDAVMGIEGFGRVALELMELAG